MKKKFAKRAGKLRHKRGSAMPPPAPISAQESASREKNWRAALAIAAGTAAYADIARALGDAVRFDNPPPGQQGHFDWKQGSGPYPPPVYLNIREPADVQDNLFDGPGTFAQLYSGSPQYYLRSSVDGHLNAGQILKARGVPYYIDPLAAGTTIGANLPFPSAASDNESITLLGYYGSTYTDLTRGVPTYLGVRFWEGGQAGFGQFNFGWIEVQLGLGGDNKLEALAWGYETDINAPIAAGAPEPGTLEALAFGFGAALMARRRGSSR